MSGQHFVYAEFSVPNEAVSAVSALVDGHIEPDQIDVLTVTGSKIERVQLKHRRPVVAGAALGMLFGMLIGLTVGLLTNEPGTDVWAASARWIVLGAACGFLAGGLGGGGWWRSGIQLRGISADAQRFVVGAIVADTRSLEIENILKRTSPLETGRHPVTDAEIARQFAEHRALVTP